MRSVAMLMLSAVIFNCSTKTPQSANEKVVKDTLHTLAANEEVVIDPDSMALAIQLEIDKTASSIINPLSKYYTITSTFSGYENSADGTWYVDSLLNLRRCELTWSTEYTSGYHDYYFADNNILAGTEDNAYNDYEESVWIHTAFKPTYGYSKTNGTENDSTLYFLQEGDYESRNASIRDDFNNLLNRISEYQDSILQSSDKITIHIENVVNHGDDITETEDYTVSKVLFHKIIKVR